MSSRPRLASFVGVLLAFGAAACARLDPELRLATLEPVEDAALETGAALTLRGEGFPVGVPTEVAFDLDRRSYMSPGALRISLPGRSVAHDAVELPLDAVTTSAFLAPGDDDARLSGTVAIRFHTRGAVITTAPASARLRIRAFPRSARVAEEKRNRLRESLGAIGLAADDTLAVTRADRCLARTGDVALGDRLAAVDGLPVASIDDALPPPRIGLVGVDAIAPDGTVHHARGLVGLPWLGRAAGFIALVALAVVVLRRARRSVSRLAGVDLPVRPNAGILAFTAVFAAGGELVSGFLRVRGDAPLALGLVAILLFGPTRRSLILALSFGLALSAALVSGGVYRIDELHGPLAPAALPGLAAALFVWGQRFGGESSSRSAQAAFLLVGLPLVHVVAPQVGAWPSAGRALAAASLAILLGPPLQRRLGFVREGLEQSHVGVGFVGSLAALAAAVSLGSSVGAAAASVLFVGHVLLCALRGSLRPRARFG